MSWRSFFGFSQPALELTAEVKTTKTNIENKEKSMFARITEDNKLFSPNGELVSSYSRRRDAVRGAERRGFKLA